ncbi:MAG: Gfo/Idh/MocA family protein [Candidatus Zixiibacteriota bacterium]
MIKVGIIGFGYWGPNIARNVSLTEGLELKAICDIKKDRREEAASLYPSARIYEDARQLILSDDIDAVAVVTPVHTHYELGKIALDSDKHLFIEKPFTSTVSQAEELIDISHKKGRLIMVDHTFLFTGAVRKMKEIIDSGELGDLFFYDSVRVNLGLFQHDVNVIWDLAPHDISIMDYLIKEKPKAVSSVGVRHFQNGYEDVAYITVFLNDTFIAHFHCNWLTPVKIRKTLISGDRKMLVWDDLSADEKVKVYDKGVEMVNGGYNSVDKGIYQLLVSYRSGDVYIPKIDNTEALRLEMKYFEECIRERKKPFNDGEQGLRVVKILEAANKSLKKSGLKVILNGRRL